MIKELIMDLAHDKISLTQGLTRAKLIAAEIKNGELKDWIYNELNGYKAIDNLPEYRIFKVEIRADVIDSNGYKEDNVLLLMGKLGEKLGADMNIYHELHSLSLIEDTVNKANTDFVISPLHQEIIKMLSSGTQKEYGQSIITAGRSIHLSQLKNILDQTKQKLLDILLELDSEFPDLKADFEKATENTEKAKSIVTLNIHGDIKNTQFGVGQTVEQGNFTTNIYNDIEEFTKHLKELGVPEADIDELQEIIESTEKPKFHQKLLKWLGNLGTKAVEKGLELQMPQIIAAVTNFIDQAPM